MAEDVAFGPLNLGKSRDEALAIVDRTLDDLHLSHLRDRITHKLSGGEKRLVTLATVLAMEPEVLLLDEPTNALDTKNESRLREILTGLSQAILLVSHDLAVISHMCERVAVMRLGEVVEALHHAAGAARSSGRVNLIKRK